MKPIKNYILLVDRHRDFRSKYMKPRNTAGRYRVGAKTPKEAVELLREKIGFGSIIVYYECNEHTEDKSDHFVSYKTVVKEVPSTDENGKFAFKQVKPHHATENQKNK